MFVSKLTSPAGKSQQNEGFLGNFWSGPRLALPVSPAREDLGNQCVDVCFCVPGLDAAGNKIFARGTQEQCAANQGFQCLDVIAYVPEGGRPYWPKCLEFGRSAVGWREGKAFYVVRGDHEVMAARSGTRRADRRGLYRQM